MYWKVKSTVPWSLKNTLENLHKESYIRQIILDCLDQMIKKRFQKESRKKTLHIWEWYKNDNTLLINNASQKTILK